jgi:hypothetical protein
MADIRTGASGAETEFLIKKDVTPMTRNHMRALTWQAKRSVPLETVPDPNLKEPNDAIMRVKPLVTSSMVGRQTGYDLPPAHVRQRLRGRVMDRETA